jgi:sterol desaturase/sphingolipid hydroxylase (fatty acid hydroxylase superfamily)
MLDDIQTAIFISLAKLALPQSPYFVGYIACAGMAAAFAYFLLRGGRRRSLRGLLRFVFPRRILLHPSARLDYQYYFIGAMIHAVMLTGMALSSTLISQITLAALASASGLTAPFAGLHWLLAAVIMTVTYVLLFDLGYWIGHRLMHEIPLLWEFHQPHHAAEVMTPITSTRAHPMEDIIQSNAIAVVVGFGHGVSLWLLGPEAQPISLLGINVILLAFYVTLFHLRHSHVWLPVSGRLAYIIQSPAHHQIHHSDDPRHMGKNLGFCLSFWDWMFGTLYVPSAKENLTFGLGEESQDYRSLQGFLLQPFVKAWSMGLHVLKGGRRPNADIKVPSVPSSAAAPSTRHPG